jgi:hypothetical protein
MRVAALCKNNKMKTFIQISMHAAYNVQSDVLLTKRTTPFSSFGEKDHMNLA